MKKEEERKRKSRCARKRPKERIPCNGKRILRLRKKPPMLDIYIQAKRLCLVRFHFPGPFPSISLLNFYAFIYFSQTAHVFHV